MIIERDLPITMADGIELRADVYRPDDDAQAPAILTMGPYGKGLPFSEAHYAPLWNRMIEDHPEILAHSSGKFVTWETVDPEIWIPAGYAVIRVDSRGAGRSPGYLDIWSRQEAMDLYECIEWAASQSWCTGKVGMSGTSYFAMNQWWVAALHPPHLAAMVIWEGANDFYREISRQGGILANEFFNSWYNRQVFTLQHGRAGLSDAFTGESLTGPETLTDEELRANRFEILDEIRGRPLDDEFYRRRSADFAQIDLPFLSAAEWAHFDLHGRGNIEGFTESASEQKWLEVHSGTHQELFYLPYGVELQMKFLDHFLKGEDNGWDREPRVWLNIRHTDRHTELRKENEWPLERTQWTKLFLDTSNSALTWQRTEGAGATEFKALQETITFLSDPLEAETEITGPAKAVLHVASSTHDADLFLTLRVFEPDGTEVDFKRHVLPLTPLSKGWLRVSHRKIDEIRSKPWRPYHSHDEAQPLIPGQIYEVNVEILPTCVVLGAGCRIALSVGGKDFVKEGSPEGPQQSPYQHTDPGDRPEDVFGGTTQLHSGTDRDSYILLPIIPAKR